LTTHEMFIRQAHFPAPAPPIRRTLDTLQTLENWCNAGALTTVATAVALPLLLSTHTAYRVGTICALIIGALLTLLAQLARECRLRALVIHPEFAQLPSVARKRRRLVSPRSRAALARWLRETAATTRPPTRFDISPVLHDRLAHVRTDLRELASALELDRDPDPGCVALIRELLRDGAGPLYNPNLPPACLHWTLARVRAGLIPTDEGGDYAHRH
jgi:hypothetical protein